MIKNFFLVFFYLLQSSAFCCSDFLLMTQDKNAIVARSMDFDDCNLMISEIRLHSPGKQKQAKIPDGFKPLQWSNKYGFIGVHVFELDCVVDGMNEKGLSFAYLWMDGSNYSNLSSNENKFFLALEDVGEWILGNFETVKEAKDNLSKIAVWGYPVYPLDIVPPLHIALHDATGNSSVIEFIEGKIEIYDNFLGILTNDPPFCVQLNQLERGIHSRFTELVSFKQDILPPINANAGVLLAFHLLNRLDIPFGNLNELKRETNSFHFTIWSLVKDLSNRIFYFRTYDQINLKKVDLTKINFSEIKNNSILLYPSKENLICDDITVRFLE